MDIEAQILCITEALQVVRRRLQNPGEKALTMCQLEDLIAAMQSFFATVVGISKAERRSHELGGPIALEQVIPIGMSLTELVASLAVELEATRITFAIQSTDDIRPLNAASPSWTGYSPPFPDYRPRGSRSTPYEAMGRPRQAARAQMRRPIGAIAQ